MRVLVALGALCYAVAQVDAQVADDSVIRVAGTYQLDLLTVPGPETARRADHLTMLLVLGADSSGYATMGDNTPWSDFRGFPPNACWSEAPAGEITNTVHVARWRPGRGDTTRVTLEFLVEGRRSLVLVSHGDSVTGVELFRDTLATFHGRRTGPPNPEWCLQVRHPRVRPKEI